MSSRPPRRLQTYATDAITVTFDPTRCIHAAECIRTAPAVFDSRRRRLICVREDHTDADREPITTLVSIAIDGPETSGEVLASGYDFYSTPRLSPDGTRLAWLAWPHPNMPWDGTELWIADVNADGALERAACVAGGPSESIYQPGWSPGGPGCAPAGRPRAAGWAAATASPW